MKLLDRAAKILGSLFTFRQGFVPLRSRFPDRFSSDASIKSFITQNKTSKNPTWLPSGWRRMAIFNIGTLAVTMLFLLSIFLIATAKTDNFMQSWRFFSANCGRTTVTNTMLHLLINIFSTLVLASSNFFMQVLNAPTRSEVDAAHAQGKWLDIGVPSWRNAFCLSRFKRFACLSLLLTSVPIHMIFNSSVFKIDKRMGDFHATIATEAFTNGGSYFLPGASMVTSDLYSGQNNARAQEANMSNPQNSLERIFSDDFGDTSLLPTFQDLSNANYSEHALNVSEAAAQASRWEKLGLTDCRGLFNQSSCTGLNNVRNVVLIVKGSGWKRSDVWNISTTTDGIWEPIVPGDRVNNLWYSAQCNMRGELQDGYPSCLTNCKIFFDWISGENEVTKKMETNLSLQEWFPKDRGQPFWNTSMYSAPGNDSQVGFRLDKFSVTMDSCRVEPRETTCSVVLAKPLLLVVIISIFIKGVTCIGAMLVLGNEEPLVTLGDAVASFISIQPQPNFVSGLMTHYLVQGREREGTIYELPRPRRWVKRQHHRSPSVAPRVWIQAYCLFIPPLMVLLFIVVGQFKTEISKWNNAETARVMAPIGGASIHFLSAIVVNIPQLYLSSCYYVINSLITQLEMSWEWDQFSITYCPLRVTKPRGQQISTYRLQLPYKFSVPLIGCSILVHWLLSNALFIVVSQGNPGNLPDDAAINLSSSRAHTLALIFLSTAMVVFPMILSRQKLLGQMPVVGSNSLAIAAACRVSPLAQVPTDSDERKNTQDTELAELVSATGDDIEAKKEADAAKEMIYFPLKWGEVKMPKDWHDQPEEGRTSEEVSHLSFGTVLDTPSPPKEGRLYV